MSAPTCILNNSALFKFSIILEGWPGFYTGGGAWTFPSLLLLPNPPEFIANLINKIIPHSSNFHTAINCKYGSYFVEIHMSKISSKLTVYQVVNINSHESMPPVLPMQFL